MPSPTFNGNNLFDSTVDAAGTKVTEGLLFVPAYSAISQRIHFEGEIGDYTLWHGYADMPWYFEGYVAGTTTSQFNTIIQGIQSAIDDAQAGNYHSLVDSFGNVYNNAQIRELIFLEAPHVWRFTTSLDGYVAKIRVTGVIQNANTQIGASS